MSVQIISLESCRSFGEAIRDLDTKGLIRGNFILMSADTVTNANLLVLMEKHRENSKKDKLTTMTVVYKKVAAGQRTGDEVVAATERESGRLLFHQRIKQGQKERHFQFNVEIFLEHSEVVLHHDLMDPQIVICGPTVMPLFSDNFDYESLDQFIGGQLMKEDIVSSTIYMVELAEEYAAKVSSWSTYQMVSKDIINRWVYPLVPDMGICSLKQEYLFSRNNIYKSKNVCLTRGAVLKNDVVLQEKCAISENTTLVNCVLGRNCKIGKNCSLNNVFLFDNVLVEDDCVLNYCVLGNNVKVSNGSVIKGGTVIGDGSVILPGSNLTAVKIQSLEPEKDDFIGGSGPIKLGNFAYQLEDREEEQELNSDDEDNVKYVPIATRLGPIESNYASSIYSCSSDDEDSLSCSPVLEDFNSMYFNSRNFNFIMISIFIFLVFMNEVMESLKRCFDEKSNPEYLVLEINSSRYAYNMSLPEVNFFVVKAFLNLPVLEESSNVMTAFNQAYEHMYPVLTNYINKPDSMRHCLNAIAECCTESAALKPKIAQIIHYLYDKDILGEQSILDWHQELSGENEWIKTALNKLVDWLQQSSEEESD